MSSSAAPVAAVLGVVVMVPVLIVAMFAGGTAAPATPAGAGLKAGTVPARYLPLVLAAGAVCATATPAVIAAQLEQESGWNPAAVSPAGAQGIAQFLPSTWATWSMPGQSPFDPAAAIAAQGRYDCAIAAQMTRWQSSGQLPAGLGVLDLMLAGYNAGPYAVLVAQGVPQNGQTPGYVNTIEARAGSYFASTGAPVVAPAGSFAAKMIAFAESQVGVPYAWAGGTDTGPSVGVCDAGNGAPNDCTVVGWDCSGLVMYAVYQASGGRIQLSHYVPTQVSAGGGQPVSRAELRPGDVIAFNDPGSTFLHHTGIYLGNGQMIDAPESNEQVRIDSLTSSYYQSQGWTIRRYG